MTKLEIETALREEPLVLRDRTRVGEIRFNAIGRVKDRSVFVVFTFRERDGKLLARPISARYMHDKEVRRYARTIAPQG